VLKVDDFMKKIDTYIIEILQSENKDNVRLKSRLKGEYNERLENDKSKQNHRDSNRRIH
jgi:hypothetical protein